MEQKQETTQTPPRNRALTVVGVILCIILIPLVLINCTLIVKQLINKDEVPNVGGVFPMIVLTNSMQGTFDGGSLIFCKTANAKDIKAGDIICFFDPAGNGSSTTTHRVKEVQTDDAGNISFITKGDANNTEDKTPVPANKLVGKYWFRIAGLGSAAMFMQTTPGLIIFVIVPILLLVAYDVFRRRRFDAQKDAETAALEEELRALRAQKNAQPMTGAPNTPAVQNAQVAAGVPNAQLTQNAQQQQIPQPQPLQPQTQQPVQTLQPQVAQTQTISQNSPQQTQQVVQSQPYVAQYAQPAQQQAQQPMQYAQPQVQQTAQQVSQAGVLPQQQAPQVVQQLQTQTAQVQPAQTQQQFATQTQQIAQPHAEQAHVQQTNQSTQAQQEQPRKKKKPAHQGNPWL